MLAAPQTVEAWAEAYVLSDDLAYKLAPPALPERWATSPLPTRLAAPGRPAVLLANAGRLRPPRSLESNRARAKLMHTFFHHELQAAELMCWALLLFSESPPAFRRGLLNICQDEIRHMGLYRGHIAALGFKLGDFPIRDWFWRRTPNCERPEQFVALMGMGLEAANLEHAAKFAAEFREAGDERGAAIQEQVLAEELPHVRFAVHWFEAFTGAVDFGAWKLALPAPLSPLLMRGSPLSRSLRARAGMPADFIEALAKWQPDDEP